MGFITDIDFSGYDVDTPLERLNTTFSTNGHQSSLAQRLGRGKQATLREVASTRVLIAAGRLVAEGLPMHVAAEAAIAGPLTDDVAVNRSLKEMINVYLSESVRSGD